MAHIGKATAVALVLATGMSMSAKADEADAKHALKAMSDYMTKQTAISFVDDANLEVVTEQITEKLMLANSGTIDLVRPDKYSGDAQWGIFQRRDGL